MELIAKISKGSLMDQIYLPKNRQALETGTFVIVKSIEESQQIKKQDNLKFYNIKNIEPVKIEIIDKITALIKKEMEFENIIITGSFLNKGFNFKDIDILIIIK